MTSERRPSEGPLLPDPDLLPADTTPAVDRRAFMALTAKEMNSKYKETSEGGLAVSVVLC